MLALEYDHRIRDIAAMTRTADHPFCGGRLQSGMLNLAFEQEELAGSGSTLGLAGDAARKRQGQHQLVNPGTHADGEVGQSRTPLETDCRWSS